jgi:LysR family transcriptional regulator, cyn operon transcriptional activator
MELRHLRYFAAVADAGSVSDAARRLHLTQPALSRQIQDLERDFACRLFDRIGRRIILTKDGDEILEWTRRLLADAEALQERARALAGGEAGVLRIGATPQFIEAALPGVLTRYAQTYPGIAVQLVEDGGGGLVRRVRQGELHLGIGVWRTGELQSQPLYPVRTLAVMQRRHRLAGRNALAVTELVGIPLLLLGRDFQTREWFDQACQAAHFEPSVRLESQSPQSLVALAEAGHGIAIVPSAVRLDASRVAIAGMLDGGQPLASWAHAVWDSRRYLPTYARGFIGVIEDYAKTSYPGRQLGDLTRAVPRPAPAVTSYA